MRSIAQVMFAAASLLMIAVVKTDSFPVLFKPILARQIGVTCISEDGGGPIPLCLPSQNCQAIG